MRAPLRALAERAFKWSALTTVGRFVLQLVAQVVLARMLGPDNYGVYGMALLVLTFATFLSGNSFTYVLMLQKRVTRDDIRYAFTWQLMAGLACTALMYGTAGWLGQFFGDERVADMVRLMSISCVLLALGSTATCLLQRDLNFRAVGLIQMVSYAAGYLAVGVPMAMMGYGPAALGMASVVQAAVALVGSYAVRPHPLRPLLSHPVGSESISTGRTVFVTNIVNWLLTNLDRLVIGRLLTAQAVGLYGVAYNIASIPTTLLVSALQPTFLATGAKMQDAPQQLAQAWMAGLATVLVLLTPASVVMALLAPDLVQLLYGAEWTEAGVVMAILFLCVPAWVCLGLSTPVLWNIGRKHLEVQLQLPLLALALPAWWLLAPMGIRAVALGSAAVVVARALVVTAAGVRALRTGWAPLRSYLLRGLVLGAVAAGAVMAGQYGVAGLEHPAASLLAGGACAALAFLLIVALRPHSLGPEAQSMLARLVPAVGPRWAAPAPEPHP